MISRSSRFLGVAFSAQSCLSRVEVVRMPSISLGASVLWILATSTSRSKASGVCFR